MASQSKQKSHLTGRLLRYLIVAVFGGCATLLGVAIVVLIQKSDLDVWHTRHLNEEFTRDGTTDTFREYLDLEKKLFGQLHSEVYSQVRDTEQNSFNRFLSGSKSDPAALTPNWNKTFELVQTKPAAVALMLHGLSDSPYSMRALGQYLNERGFHVVGLRIPGHGTAPSGLVRTSWQDMAAAVRIAMDYADQLAGNQPVVMIGYSNGAALALNYTLNAILKKQSKRPDRLVLLSPEIEVSPAAVLAKWQARFGELFGLHKLAWSSVKPEYDPYKYNSFSINAGDLAYQITGENQRLLDELAQVQKLDAMPPILAFQSVADATVSTGAVVTKLFDRLAPGGHEAVFFDVDRRVSEIGLLKKLPDVLALFSGASRRYDVHLVTNIHAGNGAVELQTRAAGESQIRTRPLQMAWPEDVYSLAHIALPFAPDDPVYGRPEKKTRLVQLGNLALRGEGRFLAVPSSDLLRQHWNPFFSFVTDHMFGFIAQSNTRNP